MRIPKTIPICGIDHRLAFLSKKQMKRLTGNPEMHAFVDPDAAMIYLAKALRKNPSLLRDTVVHEAAGHAVWAASGLGWWLRGQMKHKARSKAFYEFQEVFIRWHTPLIITTLRSLGILGLLANERKR